MRRSGGFTLVEIMVSLGVLGIAAGLMFGVQARMTAAFRDQQSVSELQQTLRTAAAVITKDVRDAGYLASAVYEKGDASSVIPPVQVTNGSGGAPDVISLMSASDNCSARVCDTNGQLCPHHGPPFNSAETELDNANCFKQGDLAYAVRTISVGQSGQPNYVPAGTGCILYITHDPQSSSGGSNQKIQHHPASPWNVSGNAQCQPLDPNGTTWNDGYTMFMHIRLRSYRIKPDDARGVLQMSDDGELNWQDIAFGIVDLQFALRVAHDDANDLDKDGDAKRDWISGDEMSTLTDAVTNPTILNVSVTLLGRSLTGVNGPKLTEVPSLMDANWPSAEHPNGDASHNRLSDKGAVTLPASNASEWPHDMYNDDGVYRSFTTTLDLRNVGVGIDGHS